MHTPARPGPPEAACAVAGGRPGSAGGSRRRSAGAAAGAGPGPDEQAPRHRSQRRRVRGAAAPAAAGAGRRGDHRAGRPAGPVHRRLLVLRVPDPADAVQPQQVALVSFADGSQLGPLVPAAGTRVTVPIARVPAHVRAAVLAAEDPELLPRCGLRRDHPAVPAAGPPHRGGRGLAVAPVRRPGAQRQDLAAARARTRSWPTTSTRPTSAAAATASRRPRRPTSARTSPT